MHHNITAGDNDFNGPIPSEIEKLTALLGLNFGKCVCITVTQCFVPPP